MDKLPFKKRGDPFANLTNTKKSEVVVEEEKEVKRVVKVKPAPKPKKVASNEVGREKYTATMATGLRRRVKIAAVTQGVQVSSFIEEACKEKLEREGL